MGVFLTVHAALMSLQMMPRTYFAMHPCYRWVFLMSATWKHGLTGTAVRDRKQESKEGEKIRSRIERMQNELVTLTRSRGGVPNNNAGDKAPRETLPH